MHLRTRLSAFLASGVITLALLTVLTPPPASAGTHDDPAVPSGSGPILVGPRVFDRHQPSLARAVDRAIHATRRGDSIRAAYYRFDLRATTRELVAAHRRGVSVQIVLNQPSVGNTAMKRELARLRAGLGTNRSARSFAVLPASSGLSRDPAANMHTKFITFSRAGRNPFVSFIGSANLNGNSESLAWNETQVVVNDPVVFTALHQYVADIARDRGVRRSDRRISRPGLTLYLYPGAPNVIGKKLAKVKPRKGCRITVATYRWATSRIADARRLARLAKRGCTVRVMVNNRPDLFPAAIAKVLLRSRVQVRNLQFRYRGADTYVHAKTWVINRTVYAGSANPSERTRKRNADVLTVRTSRDAAGRANLAAYNRWLDRMWKVARPVSGRR